MDGDDNGNGRRQWTEKWMETTTDGDDNGDGQVDGEDNGWR